MPRTLTAGALAKIQSTAYTYDVLLEAPLLELYWSRQFEGPPFAGQWSHRIEQMSDLEESIPPGGGLAHVSIFRLTIIDDGGAGSPLKAWNRFGRLRVPLTIKILLSGETYANAIELATLRIESVTRRNARAEIIAVDPSLIGDMELPAQILDATGYPRAPDQSLNQRPGIVYGRGTDLALIPTLLVDVDPDPHNPIRTYLAASHDCRVLEPKYALWPQGADFPKGLLNDTTAVTSARDLRLSKTITEQVFGLEPAQRSVTLIDDVTGAVNVIDNADGIHALVETRSVNPQGFGFGQLGVSGRFTHPEAMNVLRVDVRQHARGGQSATTVTGRLFARTTDHSQVPVREPFWSTEQFRHVSFIRNDVFEIPNFAHEDGHFVQVVAESLNENGAGSNLDYYIVGEIYIFGGYQPFSPLEQLFLAGYSSGSFEGRADDASGTFSGVPGGLLLNPVDVLYSECVRSLGLAIDASEIATARAARAAWEVAGGIGAGWLFPQLRGRDWLQALAEQAGVYVIPEKGNTFRILAAGADMTPVLAFTQAHVLMSPGEAETTLLQEAGDIDRVAYAFDLAYAWHPGRLRFVGQRFANQSGTNTALAGASLGILLQNSYARYGMLNLPTWRLDAWLVGTAETADQLLDHTLSYHWSEDLRVRWETTFLALQLRLGEACSLTHPWLPTYDNGQPLEVVGLLYRLSQGTIGLQTRRIATQWFDYLHILDQSDTDWYWYLDDAGGIAILSTPPSVGRMLAIDQTPTPTPYWIELIDTDTVTWYLYPDAEGALTVSTSQPAVGTGMSGLTLKSLFAKYWTYIIDTEGGFAPVEGSPPT